MSPSRNRIGTQATRHLRRRRGNGKRARYLPNGAGTRSISSGSVLPYRPVTGQRITGITAPMHPTFMGDTAAKHGKLVRSFHLRWNERTIIFSGTITFIMEKLARTLAEFEEEAARFAGSPRAAPAGSDSRHALWRARGGEDRFYESGRASARRSRRRCNESNLCSGKDLSTPRKLGVTPLSSYLKG